MTKHSALHRKTPPQALFAIRRISPSPFGIGVGVRAEDCCDPRSDGSQYAAAAHQTTPSPVGEGWGGVRLLCRRCRNHYRTALSPVGEGWGSPVLPPMQKQPPNGSLPRWGGSGWGSLALPPMPKQPPNDTLAVRKVGVSSPALPPMPKQPPNDVLAMRKVGLGFARFAADAKTTAERLPLPVGEG